MGKPISKHEALSRLLYLRPYSNDDRNFVISAYCQTIDQPKLANLYGKVFDKLKLFKHCQIAYTLVQQPNGDEEENLVGYCIHLKGTIYFLYVKPIFRKLGVGKWIAKACVNGRHRTTLLRTKDSKWLFGDINNPKGYNYLPQQQAIFFYDLLTSDN